MRLALSLDWCQATTAMSALVWSVYRHTDLTSCSLSKAPAKSNIDVMPMSLRTTGHHTPSLAWSVPPLVGKKVAPWLRCHGWSQLSHRSPTKPTPTKGPRTPIPPNVPSTLLPASDRVLMVERGEGVEANGKAGIAGLAAPWEYRVANPTSSDRTIELVEFLSSGGAAAPTRVPLWDR